MNSDIIIINNIPYIKIKNYILIKGILVPIKVCRVARDGSRMVKVCRGFTRPIWIGAIYTLKQRVKDKCWTYRRTGSFGRSSSGKQPSKKLEKELMFCAPFDWDYSVYHGKILEI